MSDFMLFWYEHEVFAHARRQGFSFGFFVGLPLGLLVFLLISTVHRRFKPTMPDESHDAPPPRA